MLGPYSETELRRSVLNHAMYHCVSNCECQGGKPRNPKTFGDVMNLLPDHLRKAMGGDPFLMYAGWIIF